MTTLCPLCHNRTPLPPDLEAGAHLACEHCGALLVVEDRYTVCADCGRLHRRDYEVCPFAAAGAAPVFGQSDLGAYSVEAQKRRTHKRGDQYYWQLYVDYRDRHDSPAASPVPAAPAAPAEPDDLDLPPLPEEDEPPHPAAASAAHAPQPSNGRNGSNGAYRNGNGNGHGYGNGKGSGKLDLAVAPSVPVTLFPEIDVESAAGETNAPVKVTAGNYNEFEYELISDQSRLAEVAELLAHEKVIGVDTETTGLDPHTSELLLLQISTLDKVYVIDSKRVVPLALKPILENAEILKVAQNAKFEYEMLKQKTGISLAGMFDTMLAERMLTAGVGREISLKAIAQKYVGAVLDKSVRETFYKLAQNGDAYLASEQLHYAARDAFIMIPIWQLQNKEIRKQRLVQTAELEFRCIAAVGDLELAGVRIDVERWRKIIADVAVQRDKSQEELSEILAPATMQATMFGVPSINLNSSTQLMEVFATLGVNLPDTMEATLVKFDHPAVAKLLEYRSHEKTLSAFGENVLGLINPMTGRIHPDFNQYGADTGRFSCLAGDTLISSATGLKRIDSIEQGDVVQTSFGPRRVLAAWCNGERPLIRVTLSDGRVLRLTADHRVLSGNADAWRPVEELSAGDNLFLSVRGAVLNGDEVSPQLDIDPGTYYAKRKAVVPQTLSESLCELAGLITADGYFGENPHYKTLRGKRGRRYTDARYDRVFIACGWDDDELIEKVKAYSATLFGIAFGEQPHKTCRLLTLASTQVCGALTKLGLSGSAHTKSVPKAILEAPARFQAAYLRGLFEGDGHINGKGDHIGLVSVNPNLLRTVQTMLSFLGCYANLRKRNDVTGFSGSPRYELSISGGENLSTFMRVVGFMTLRKNERSANVTRTPSGAVTPLRISGAKLYREAVAQGLVSASRQGVKPFIPYYKAHPLSTLTIDRMVSTWGRLPSLEQASLYRERRLHCVQVASIEPDGIGVVFDLTVDGVSEFLANGIGVHNCTKPNIQQIPATSDFRKCFVSAPGYKLVTSDYSQAELRILAELSGDPAFVDAFRSGQDLHTLTASQMFGVTVDQVQKSQRSAAKAINFGLAYGMGPGGLAPRLGVTLDEAKELISRYFKAYPGIQRWLDKAGRDAVRLGYSATPLGRKRYYNLPDESLKRLNEDEWRKQIAAIERQGKNSPIQGCVVGSTRIFEESRGYAPIESLRGEVVSVWDGDRFSKAVVVYSGKKQRVKVTLRGGHYIECSPDHKFLVACNNGYKWVWKWKPITEIKAQNRVVLGNPVGDWHLPLDAPVAVPGAAHNANSASITAIHSPVHMGEWPGRLASDGSIGKNHAITMPVAEHEEDILPHLESVTREMGAVGHSVRVTATQPRRLHALTVCSKSLSDQMRAVGVKHSIPAFVWRDGALLAGYLRGLFDGDGTVHPDSAVLVFGGGDKHLDWARQVQEALLLFGIRSRINLYTDRHNRINLRILKRDMPLFCEKIGFLNPIKQQKAFRVSPQRWERVSPQYGMAMLVEAIEVTDEYVDMYDVVNSESHQFMANGMIVHNCNADMTKLALINLRAALKPWDARTVNTVHDEIVVEVREDQAEEVKHIVEREMVAAGEAILKEVPIVADAAVADYWSK